MASSFKHVLETAAILELKVVQQVVKLVLNSDKVIVSSRLLEHLEHAVSVLHHSTHVLSAFFLLYSCVLIDFSLNLLKVLFHKLVEVRVVLHLIEFVTVLLFEVLSADSHVLGSADSFSVFDSLLNPVLSVESTESQKDEDWSDSVGTSLEDFHVVLFGQDVQQFEVLSCGGVVLLSLALRDVLYYLNDGFS